jgi:hypothetical protein
LEYYRIVCGDWDKDTIFVILVDGVHCHTCECCNNPSSKRYSHKFGAPRLAYELGISIRSNQLVWINGPFLVSVHNITNFRKPGGLKTKIPPGKRAIGNSGYQGEPDHVAVRNGPLGKCISWGGKT